MASTRRRIDSEIYKEIHREVRQGTYINATELHKKLMERFPDKVPSERTVRNIVRDLLPPDSSGPWLPGPDNNPEEDACVLTTLAEFIAGGNKFSQWGITREHARWLAWVRTGWPDIPAQMAVVLAMDYRARREAGEDTTDLDTILAFAPWRSNDHYMAWQTASNKGQIPEVQLFYVTVAAVHRMQQTMGQCRNEKGTRE